MNWQSSAITILAQALGRPLALAAAAWLILRIFRVRHPASKHAVWTAVLAGMLLLPVVTVMSPHWKLPVLSPTMETAAPISNASLPGLPAGAMYRSGDTGGRFRLPETGTLLLWCYGAGLLAMLVYRAAGWAMLQRMVARSIRLRARLRESGDLVTPVAVGVWRPSVLLPSGWRTWSAATRRAVLAHEFAHLRRHDALVSGMARLVKCLYWFHPLAWWVSRQISETAELACDAAALEKVDDPAGYSRILLSFAEAVNRAGHRSSLPGMAMAAGSGMDHRVEQVFELSGGKMRKLARPGMLMAAIGLPVLCLAATLEFVEAGTGSQEPVASSQKPGVGSPKQMPQLAMPAAVLAQVQTQKKGTGVQGPAGITAATSKDVSYIITDEERAAFLVAQVQRKGPDTPGPTSMASPYRKWLTEDVAYIITDSERATFRDLTTDDERERFIERFWLRRDPTPGTVENEFKEEHYRRIAYTNEHFGYTAKSLPGWKTDRGRIYITYGPADEIEDHSAGGIYTQGSAQVQTYPFQRWRYKYIEGIGTNVIIEFIDPSGTGEYRMTSDPNEKVKK